MENIWFQSALWMALALIAAIGSFFITISAALFEIVVGAVAGNTVGLPLTPWIDYIASFGAIVLTFLAGTDIDPHVVKRNLASSVTIGLVGFCTLSRLFAVGSLWAWLAMVPSTDRRYRTVHNVRGGRVCGYGRRLVTTVLNLARSYCRP
jgi:Kef-type K+ transport system membrane component KefB